MEEHDLMSLLSQELRADRRAFQPRKGMREWESAVCIYLLAHGYETSTFETVDGDSFGPLVRGVHVRKFGQEQWQLHTYG